MKPLDHGYDACAAFRRKWREYLPRSSHAVGLDEESLDPVPSAHLHTLPTRKGRASGIESDGQETLMQPLRVALSVGHKDSHKLYARTSWRGAHAEHWLPAIVNQNHQSLNNAKSAPASSRVKRVLEGGGLLLHIRRCHRAACRQHLLCRFCER